MRRNRPTGAAKSKSAPLHSPQAAPLFGPLFLLRLRFWAVILLLLGFVAAGRLVQVQLLRHSHYLKRAHNSHLRQWTIPAARGNIFDRNGKTLAMNLSLKSVFVDPELYRQTYFEADDSTPRPDAAQEAELSGEALAAAQARAAADSRRLADLLKISSGRLQEVLQRPGRYVMLKRGLPEEAAAAVEALKFRWVGLLDEPQRTYPFGPMAAQTLGFVGTEATGLAGIEASQDTLLQGRAGKISLEVDARGRPISGLRAVRNTSQPGQDLTLTLDLSLQQIAEVELARGIEEASAAGGAVIIMDPQNGEILALASQPSFDPNNFAKAPPERWVNPVVVGAYEPGSTFKVVLACAALQEGAPFANKHIVCSGEKTIGRRVIHCALHDGKRAHGSVDLETIIAKSCNIGVAEHALALGSDRLFHYVDALGFGHPTGIELSAESSGQVPSPGGWSDIRCANIAFGQGLSVTPLQMLRAYAAIANGGFLITPHLIKSETEPPPAPRVLSAETSRAMRRMLISAVEEGTGTSAAIEGYYVAGKTGTAQKPTPEAGYKSGKYIGSFIGLVPAERPQLAILVLIDEPSGMHFGSVVAAPVFREVARQGLLHLDLPPSRLQAARAPSSQPAHNISYHTPE